jgi:hypothetical protein
MGMGMRIVKKVVVLKDASAQEARARQGVEKGH